MAKSFNQKNGLSEYALDYGYIQRAARHSGGGYELRVDLFKDCGAYYVRAHEYDGRGQLAWESFDTLTAARAFWVRLVKEHHGSAIAEAKADKRFWVSREFCGESEPFYVARMEGASRSSWVGKSRTEYGAWLLVFQEKQQMALKG